MPADYYDSILSEMEKAYDRREREFLEEQEEINPKEWDEFCESVIIANAGKFTDEELEYIEFAKGEIADHNTNWQHWR